MRSGEGVDVPGRERGHGVRRLLRWVASLLVLGLVVGGVVVWRYDLSDPLLDRVFGAQAEGPPDPVTIAPPPGLDLPPLAPPTPVAAPVTGAPRINAAEVRRTLAPYLSDPDLGRHVEAVIAPLAGGPAAFATGDEVAIPASTTKLVTTAAALITLGPDATFETEVVAAGRRVVLVGGGDPFLASGPPEDPETVYPPRADVLTLGDETAKALLAQGKRRITVGYDDSLFTGPTASPTWEPDYVPDGVVSPITSLWVDEGRPAEGFGRVPDPALTAATVFAGALSDAGVEVVGVPQPALSPPSGARLASVSSAPLSMIVERILDVSDNEASEVLLRHVGLAVLGDASFDGGQRGVVRTLREQGVDLSGSTLYDGSGLSRANRLTPSVLVDVLRLAASPDRPQLRPVLTGLPVAGFTGSLAVRFEEAEPAGRGRVRAKTGTLTGVSSLAGVVVDLDGNPLVFVLMADRVKLEDTLDARDALDNAAAALGACRCGR